MTLHLALLGPDATPDEVDEFVAALTGSDDGEPRHLSLKHDQTKHGSWAVGGETLSAPSDMDMLTPGDKARCAKRMETLAATGRKAGTPGLATTPDAMAAETLKVAGRATPEEIAAGKRWYQDAHDGAAALGDETGYGVTKASAVTAACSPNRNWDDNQRMAAAVMRTNRADEPYMIDQATYDKLKVKPKGGPGMYRPSELDPMTDAWANPAYQALNLPGRNWTTQIAQSTRILRGPDDMSVIEVEVGGPKVRNFYNNIRHPEDPLSVTIDSHQVRAMQPDGIFLGRRKDPKTGEMKDITTDNAPSTFFTSQPGGSVSSDVLEGIGLYPVFAAGMQIATDQYNKANGTNLTPSQLQAITWLVQRREHP